MGPAEPVPVLASATSVRSFSWRLSRYETYLSQREGIKKEEDPYPITANSSPTLLSLWKTLRLEPGSTELVKHPVVQSTTQDEQRKSFA
jgi:hypothetical protein